LKINKNIEIINEFSNNEIDYIPVFSINSFIDHDSNIFILINKGLKLIILIINKNFELIYEYILNDNDDNITGI
jgi:hypothetical protein